MYWVVLVLFLVRCYDNKKAKSPYNLIIHPLIKPQVANQQKKANQSTHHGCFNLDELGAVYYDQRFSAEYSKC